MSVRVLGKAGGGGEGGETREESVMEVKIISACTCFHF